MNSVKQALTRKLGPLPAWVWFLIGGGALWWYRRRATSSGTQQAGQPDLANVGPYGQDYYPIQGGSSAGTTTTGATGASTGSQPPTINVYGPKATPAPTHKKTRTRAKQHKAQHHKQMHKHPRPPKHAAHKHRPRSPAAVHHSSANHKRATGHRKRVTRAR